MKKIISLILCLILGISMIGCSSEKSMKKVATINGENIPLEYYQTYVNWTKRTYDSYGYTSEVWNTKQEDGKTYWESFKVSILDSMEQSELAYQDCKEKNILPTDKEVTEAVNNFNDYLKKDKEVEKEAKEAGINDEFLKYILTRELAYSAYQQYYIKNTKISDSELEKEYNKNKKQYNTVTASHILISTKDSEGKDVSDSKKAKAKEKAEDILKKAKAGEDFGDLAKENSDDTANAKNGGDLGAFTYEQMEENFSKAAFALNVGEISGIVETPYGYHIIKVTDKVDTFEGAKEKVKEAILSQKFTAEMEKQFKDAKKETDEKALESVKLN